MTDQRLSLDLTRTIQYSFHFLQCQTINFTWVMDEPSERWGERSKLKYSESKTNSEGALIQITHHLIIKQPPHAYTKQTRNARKQTKLVQI